MDTVQPSAMAELEQIMKQQFAKNSSSKSSSSSDSSLISPPSAKADW
jgi:flagellar motor switch protein FliG